MGTVLAVAARECQIVIFTCVPEKYAFIGEVFTSKIQAFAAMQEIILSGNKLKRILYGI